MTEIKYLTKLQQNNFLRAISSSQQKHRQRDFLFFTLALRYGLRASEGRLLEVSQVKLDENSIFIGRLKGSISQFYPLRPDDRKLIEKWIRIRNKMKHRKSKFLFITDRTDSLSRPSPAKL